MTFQYRLLQNPMRLQVYIKLKQVTKLFLTWKAIDIHSTLQIDRG